MDMSGIGSVERHEETTVAVRSAKQASFSKKWKS